MAKTMRNEWNTIRSSLIHSNDLDTKFSDAESSLSSIDKLNAAKLRTTSTARRW